MSPFKNLTLYRLPKAFLATLTPCALDAAISKAPLQAPGPMAYQQHGFYPLTTLGGAYSQRIGDRVLFRHASARRLLPTAVINAALQERLAEIEVQDGEAPGPRERRRIRDEIVVNLLPQAFVVESHTHVVIDFRTGWVWIDASSTGKAEACIVSLRDALGSFPAMPIYTKHGVRSTLTSWLQASSSPVTPDLGIGTSAVLAEPYEGSRVTARNQEMFCEEISEHLDAGKQCEQLELILEMRTAFVLDQMLNVRRIRFDDSVLYPDDSDGDDALGTATLMLAELARIVRVIEAEFEPEAPA